jgi:hypothetical protein
MTGEGIEFGGSSGGGIIHFYGSCLSSALSLVLLYKNELLLQIQQMAIFGRYLGDGQKISTKYRHPNIASNFATKRASVHLKKKKSI